MIQIVGCSSQMSSFRAMFLKMISFLTRWFGRILFQFALVNWHNWIHWFDENPHLILTSEMNQPGLTEWAGLSCACFLRARLTTRNSLTCSGKWQCQDLPLCKQHVQSFEYLLNFTTGWNQTHYTILVREFLDPIFLRRWIGWRWSIEWSLRSLRGWLLFLATQRLPTKATLRDFITGAGQACRSVADRLQQSIQWRINLNNCNELYQVVKIILLYYDTY